MLPNEPQAVVFWVVTTVITIACYAALLGRIFK